MKRTAFVVGGGRLAVALAGGLSRAGWKVAGYSRNARGQSALRREGAAVAPLGASRLFDLVFLAVPDDAIPTAFAELRPHLRRGQVIAHGAGAVGLEPLLAVRRAGAHPGSLHVLQALTGGPFEPGVFVAVDGDAAAVRRLLEVSRALRLEPVRIPAKGRALYHASAVMMAGLVMALADVARETWAKSGAPRDRALPALVPLLRGAVENLEKKGLPGALTGPVVRGDAGVVSRQLDALSGDARELYRLLSRRLLAIARQGSLTALQRRRLRAAIR
jgi:predicted short-subunit dehydrogenase-like oxidoreductase (DUF2520 family)